VIQFLNFHTFKERDNWIKALIKTKGVSPRKQLLLVSLALSSYVDGGTCHASAETVAIHTGSDTRNTKRWLRELEADQMIEVVERGGGRESNSYRFRDLVDTGVVATTRTRPVVASTTAAVVASTTGAVVATTTHSASTTANSNNVYSRPNGREINIVSSRAPNGALENGFEDFWHAYPKKRKKADARAAYGKVLADGLATADALVAGAVAYAVAREGQDDQYTQHPANWLKGECWHDEHSSIQAARKRSNVEVALEGFMGGDND
jgi:hypothetical protein